MQDAPCSPRWPLLALASAFLLLGTADASAQNMAFTVAPGGTINIQNLSGADWYFSSAPTPTTATMYRMAEHLFTAHVWGSTQFRADPTGQVSRVLPREFLRVTAGSTATGSVIRVTVYHDATFESSFAIDITVQSGGAQVLSINRLDASPITTTTSSVRWEITFDRAVAGVRTNNLALIFPDNGQPSPFLSTAVPTVNSNHTRWTVTANTNGRETGTLALKWNGTSAESPLVATAFTGQSYDLQVPPPSTFSVRQHDFIDIRNVTDDAWYFAGPPAPSGTTRMARVTENGTVEQWGSDNFGPDLNNVRNRILRNQSLRIEDSGTSIGTMIVTHYLNPQSVSKSISVQVRQGYAQLVSLTRLDPTPTTSKTARWEIVFDRPVGGVRPWNFDFLNYTGSAASITSLDPDAASGFRKWKVTTTMTGDGNGPLSLKWAHSSSESPSVSGSLVGERYDFNPLVFNVPPNGTIDIENFYADRLYFRAGPTPSSAQMYKVSSNMIAVDAWGSANFHYINNSNSTNYVSRYQYLRVAAGTTATGTSIIIRAYRTTFSTDTGFEIRVKVEVPDAQVLSANIIDPSPTVANSVRWDVTFNKTMTNVTAANFGFINTAQINPTPTVTSVVPVANTSNTVWRVTANTAGTGVGLLGLRYLGHAIESPNCPNTFSGQFYDFSAYPLITQHPTPSSAIIVTGGQAPTLSVTATIRTGETLHYNWRRRVGTVPHYQDPVVATTPSFTPATNVPGHYTYYCHVFTMGTNGNPSGYYADSLPSTMHVYDPPAITEQPGDVALPPGGSGELKVSTTGSELQYQWFKGHSGDRSQPIANTNSAVFTTPSLADNTRYWVLVSNALGTAYEVQSNTVTARVIKQVQLEKNKFAPVIHSTINDMRARAFDSEGNATPGATIAFVAQRLGHLNGTMPGGNFGGALSTGGTARATAKTDENGWATAPEMWTNTKTGAYDVLAMIEGGTTVLTAPITIENQAGAPAAFAWLTQPSSTATAGVAFAAQPRLTVHDAWANLVNGASVTAQAEQALGALQGTTTITSVNGDVNFTNLAHHTAEKLKLRITCGDAVAISNEITVLPGPVALVTAVAGTPQGARPGEQFALPLTAKVSDAYGNGIAGKQVQFSAPAGPASATFPQGTSVVTDAFGQAAVVAQANSVSGSYVVNAAAPQHPLVTPAVFQLRNLNNLETWRAENFGGEWQSNGNAANGAVPFNDGVPNLLKYAFNLNAKAADYALMTTDGTRGLPRVGIDEHGRLTITFVRRKASASPGISYTVQFSSGLTGESFAPNPLATTSTVAIDGTWERVTVVDSVSSADAETQRFARVQVSEP